MTTLQQRISLVTGAMQELRRHIHAHPEPGFEEVATAALIVEQLSQIAGIDIRTGVAGTGVVATLGAEKQGPCIALRADMDCLQMQEDTQLAHASTKPGLMHACGHDGHVACLVGAALVLGSMQEALSGPVKCIFQPAEENHGGGEQMVRQGVLDNPRVDVIFGLHSAPDLELGRVGVRAGSAMAASRYFNITVKGRGTHAAMPHKGIDPVLIGSQIICAAQSIVSRNLSPMEAGLISIPKFTGSTAANVIPDQVVLEGTLRALSNPSLDLLQERLQELVEQTALAHGGSARISFFNGYPLLENDPASVAHFREAATAVLGQDKVGGAHPATLGSEDFAYYLQEVPGAFWWLGLRSKAGNTPSLHSPRFDFNDAAIPIGIRLHCETVLRFFSGRRAVAG